MFLSGNRNSCLLLREPPTPSICAIHFILQLLTSILVELLSSFHLVFFFLLVPDISRCFKLKLRSSSSMNNAFLIGLRALPVRLETDPLLILEISSALTSCHKNALFRRRVSQSGDFDVSHNTLACLDFACETVGIWFKGFSVSIIIPS